MKCAIEVASQTGGLLRMPCRLNSVKIHVHGKAGDIVLYKHRLTRRYLNIDAVTGKFYRYANGEYVEIDRRQAFDSVYATDQ